MKMVKITINLLSLLTLLVLPTIADSQNQRLPLSSSDVFVLKVHLGEKLGKVYSQCVDDKKKCQIYKIEIDSVLFFRDTMTFKSPSDLMKCRYIVLSKQMEANIKRYGSMLIGVYSNGNPQYLILNEIYKIDSILYIPYLSPYSNSEWSCMEYTFLQRILYRLQIAKSKVIKNGKRVSINEDKITLFINRQSGKQN
jgi:hypothetical protein